MEGALIMLAWQSFIGPALEARGIAATNGVEYSVFKDDNGEIQVRWGVEGVTLAEIQPECEALLSAPATVPETITARQIRLGLLGAGLLPQVGPAIAALNEPERAAAEIEWEYATVFERGHPLINQFGAAFGLSSDQIDDLFRSSSVL